ncbi:MAG: hypothetical protein AB4206_00045 [Xenococcaceae cyanobacterium]
MKHNKLLLSLSTTIIAFTIQSCSYNNTTANQEKITNRENILVSNSNQSPKKNKKYLASFDLIKSEKLTNTARLLAGMNIKQESKLSKLKHDSNWLDHHRFFAYSWSKIETQQLAQVRQWAKENLTEINSNYSSIFYPFSGADFLYVYSFFPQAKEYILVDSEPIGTITDLYSLSSLEIKDQLQKVRNSLYPLLEFSVSSINKQKIYSQKKEVLPILYVFLARTNNRILNVEYVSIDREANIQPIREGLIPGVKIKFVPREETEPRTLYYFSADLSNQGIEKHPELTKFILKSNKSVTYLNTASYLMYYTDFTKIRDSILTNSNYLLQDDSGMPLKFFSQNQWDLKFYGKYTSPIALFSNHYQPDLRRVYNLDEEIEPLNFAIGYRFAMNESNLMLARIKKGK